MKKHLLATLVFTVLLFLWSGFTQILPWGIPSAQKVTVRAHNGKNDIHDHIQLPSNTLTTNSFDTIFNRKISTYTTNKTFSWIVTQPYKTNYTKYFIGEIITQFFVGILLTTLLVLTQNQKIKIRMLLICIVGLVTWVATYGQLLNWWGMPTKYAVGVGINLIIGWLLSGLLVSKFILKIRK